MKLAAAPLLLSASLTAFGCAANKDDGSSDSESQVTASAKAFEAKLYDEPNANPSSFCDRHTFLSLEGGAGGSFTATLENRVSGLCEIAVNPDRRTFAVKASSECGSIEYLGESGADKIRIQDHRARVCHDYRPALVEIEETRNGRTQLFYGAPASGAEGGALVSRVVDMKLYNEPKKQAESSCDRYTKLVIGQEGARFVANVREELSETSRCEVFISPNERTYDVTVSESCGSKVYDGTNGQNTLHVQDNRSRSCEDLRLDVIEVKEKLGTAEANLYGTF